MSRVMNDELLLTDEEISEALIKSPSRFDVYKHNAEVAKAQLQKVQPQIEKSRVLQELARQDGFRHGKGEADAEIARLKQENEGLRQHPKIVCLCGSTRFGKAFQDANLNETLVGNIVLSIGCNMKSDTEIFGHLSEAKLTEIKVKLDELHKRKIDLADEVLILNVGGYIGQSTRSELEYAKAHNKIIRFLEPE